MVQFVNTFCLVSTQCFKAPCSPLIKAMSLLEVFISAQCEPHVPLWQAVYSLEVFVGGRASSTYQSGKAVCSLEVVNEGCSELYVII